MAQIRQHILSTMHTLVTCARCNTGRTNFWYRVRLYQRSAPQFSAWEWVAMGRVGVRLLSRWSPRPLSKSPVRGRAGHRRCANQTNRRLRQTCSDSRPFSSAVSAWCFSNLQICRGFEFSGPRQPAVTRNAKFNPLKLYIQSAIRLHKKKSTFCGRQ